MPVLTPNQESRAYPRIGYEYLNSQKQLIRNISPSGAYLESKENYPLSSELTIPLKIPINSKEFVVNTKILRQEKLSESRYGYGISFCKLSLDQKEDLGYLLISEKYYSKVKGVFFQVMPELMQEYFSYEASVTSDLNIDSLKVAELAILLEEAFGEVIFIPDWLVSEENPEDLTIRSLVEFLIRTIPMPSCL